MSISFEVLTIVCGFILPKFILQYYGSDTNGLVSSITQFLGFISLCELGMGAVVPASLYRPLAERDNKKISSIVASAQKFYRIIAFIMLGYIGSLSLFYPMLVNESFDYVFTVTLIIIISISSFAQYYFGITYSLLLKADQKQYISFAINCVVLVLNTVISIILIKLYVSIHLVKLISSLIFVLRPVALNLYVKKHYNINARIKYEGEPIKQKWNGIAQHLANTIQEKADTVILTAMSSLLNVSIYGIYFMIINGVRSLVYSLTAGISALIGNMLARNEIDQLKKTFSKFEWMMHTVTVLLFAVTAITIVPFVKVYTCGLDDSASYIVPYFPLIMTLAIAARCIQMPYNVVIQAAGHFKETQFSAIIEPILNIIVSILMVYKFGLVGVAIGTLVSMSYRVVYLAIYLIRNILHNSAIDFLKQIIVDIVTIIIMLVSTQWIVLPVNSYFQWILYAGIIFIICLVECLGINLVFYRKYICDRIWKIKGILCKLKHSERK
ncbi:MAG: lipopolysaccharide biosynthesis protein [Candidatus Fimimorpha sp.]